MLLSYSEQFHCLVLYPGQLVPSLLLLFRSQNACFAWWSISHIWMHLSFSRRNDVLLWLWANLYSYLILANTNSFFIHSTPDYHQFGLIYFVLIEINCLKFFYLNRFLIKSFAILRLKGIIKLVFYGLYHFFLCC